MKPQSLQELKQMDKEELEQVDEYLYQGDLSAKRLLAGMIKLADRELSWQGKENSNSLRDFWYNPTKSIVEEAFPGKLEKWGASKFNRRMSQYLSSTLSDLVKDPANTITYRGLNILDDSRDRRINTFSIEKDKILFVEKDSAYRKLKPLEEVYEINIVSGSGWEATALLEDLKNELKDDIDYKLWIVSDYDPTGFRIADDFRRRGEQLGMHFESIERIGITPEQVPDHLIEEQKFTIPDNSDYDAQWLREYGIEGEKGLEIEAVGENLEEKGRALRQVIVREIQDRIDERERFKQMLEKSIVEVLDHAVVRILNNITGDLERGLRKKVLELSDLDEIDGVDIDYGSIGFQCTLDDLGTVKDADNQYMPEPPEEGALHDKAINISTDMDGRAQPPSTSSFAQRKRMKEALKEAINTGKFEVGDYIELED